MNLFKFIQEFPTEKTCRVRFKAIRDREGIICKHCESTKHYWLNSKEMYQCIKCRFRTSLRSGTVMENSKLPFQYWFMAMHLMTSTKKCFSALELQKQLNHKRYEPIWCMMHKIRTVMGKRDGLYKLEGSIEMDEGFFEVVPEDGKKVANLKRGRGSQRQATVLVMAETEKQPKSKDRAIRNKCGHFKMEVINDMTQETMLEVAKETIESTSIVRTDGFRSYNHLKKHVRRHISMIVRPEDAGKLLPWVHIAISNAKRTLLGVHHMIRDCYLQSYLNEFCYKLNRRYMKDVIFDRLLIAAMVPWY